MGSKLDILFKSGPDELGSCEAGKDSDDTVDGKYMDDGQFQGAIGNVVD